MRRLTIARSLRLALVGLALILALISAGGVASLYHARQRYENALAQASRLATAAANLRSAEVIQAEVLRDATGTTAGAARREAERAFRQAARTCQTLASADLPSARLVAAEIATQTSVQRGSGRSRLGTAIGSGALAREADLTKRLQARQQARQAAASRTARLQSRGAIALLAVAGLLALIAAMALIAALVRSIRAPLNALADAARGFAAGDLARRVEPSGPRELRELGAVFNTMGDDLATARARIEADRQQLAVTIESLGDALITTEPGSAMIATTNARVADLVPELRSGTRTDGQASPLPPLSTALEKETVIDHDGRSLAITAAPLGSGDSGSGAEGVVWTVRDVTERARLEQAKSDFVATASHELRSPLTSIKGFVELLERNPENMSARQREFIDIIRRSTNRLVELVNDLLDVARIEADRVEIKRRPMDVGEAVHEVVELMRPRISERGQRLDVSVAPALPLAFGDPARIRQIVANLLTNAHGYTEKGGSIRVAVKAEGARVKIVVADSGAGMTRAQQAHIFDRFYRAPRTSAATPGTGLGLSIVKSLVGLHHGEIAVDSEPGRGTSFQVLIPVAVPETMAGHSLEVIRGGKVLIVDDDRDVAELIADHLTPLEVQATIAGSGEEALARLREEAYEAVTLDVLMPGLDGFDVLRQIREDSELHSIPILFVSVLAGRQELAGEWSVPKPIDADELRDGLAAAVRGARSRVLIVGREEMQPRLEPALDGLGIDHHWETSGVGAARVCGERRFEVALLDVGIRNPRAALGALDLRGRRLRQAVILFGDDETSTPSGMVTRGMPVVPIEDAAPALLAALRGDRNEPRLGTGGARVRT